MPDDIATATLEAGAGETVHLPALLAGQFGVSSSEARRAIAQGGVRLDGEQLGERSSTWPPSDSTEPSSSSVNGASSGSRWAPAPRRHRRLDVCPALRYTLASVLAKALR